MNTFLFITERVLPPLLAGTLETIKMIVLAIPFSLIIGTVTAVLRLYGGKALSALAGAYVVLLRGIPLIVTLFIVYYGLPSVGIAFTPFVASVLVFSLVSGAYQAEYIRGAIQSIRIGQMMAAESIGMTPFAAVIHIILPQAIRRALPGCFNEVIYLIKYSSLAFMVTVVELTGAAKILSSRTFRSAEIFLTAGVIYLLIVTLAARLLSFVEKKLSIPGFGMKLERATEHHQLH
jgi:polar amino acid transport system permease protein